MKVFTKNLHADSEMNTLFEREGLWRDAKNTVRSRNIESIESNNVFT